MIAETVFRRVGKISMRRAKRFAHFGVGVRPGVGVAHEHRDRVARGAALEDAGKELHRVGFLARRGDVALPRPAAIQVGLHLGDRQRQPRRAAIHDHADGRPMAFAPGRDREKFAEGIGHSRKRFGTRRPSGKLLGVSANSGNHPRLRIQAPLEHPGERGQSARRAIPAVERPPSRRLPRPAAQSPRQLPALFLSGPAGSFYSQKKRRRERRL